MKKLALIAMAVLLLASCATPRLYYWGSNSSLNDDTSAYEEILYNNYDKQTPESLCALVCLYEDMVSHPGGTRNVVPPGIYAEYGYLLLQPATADAFLNHATAKQRKLFKSSDFGTFFPEHGVEMLQKEIELYPESEKFIKPLLERIKGKKS
jgi:hypothetical protein